MTTQQAQQVQQARQAFGIMSGKIDETSLGVACVEEYQQAQEDAENFLAELLTKAVQE